MGEWIFLKLEPQVNSFRIRKPYFIAVYIHPNKGRFQNQFSTMLETLLKCPINNFPVVHSSELII